MHTKRAKGVSCSLCGKTFAKGAQALYGHYGVSHRGVNPPAVDPPKRKHAKPIPEDRLRVVEDVVLDKPRRSGRRKDVTISSEPILEDSLSVDAEAQPELVLSDVGVDLLAAMYSQSHDPRPSESPRKPKCIRRGSISHSSNPVYPEEVDSESRSSLSAQKAFEGICWSVLVGASIMVGYFALHMPEVLGLPWGPVF